MAKRNPYPLSIRDITAFGYGIGSHPSSGQDIMVKGAIPGDTLTVRSIGKSHGIRCAHRISLDQPSQDRQSASCPSYPDCGGCQMQDVPYSRQLELKQAMVRDAALRFCPSVADMLKPIIPSEHTQFYRNKMEYAFGSDENGQVFLGLKKRGTFHQVIPTPKCELLSTESQALLHAISEFCTKKQWTTWDYRKHTGLLRHLMIREAKLSGAWMLNFVVADDISADLLELLQQLKSSFPQLKSSWITVHDGPGDTTFAGDIKHLDGELHIEEALGDKRFLISPRSFFQTNSTQAKVLYDEIIKAAKSTSSDTVLDLYCGTGSIGIYLSDISGHILGIEENESAINDAHQNATHNAIKNIDFRLGRVKNILKFETPKGDLVIVDPPRSGMVPKALRRVIDIQAPKMVYVSCNPVTLMQDLSQIIDAGYEVESIQAVDMFPHTFHIETVVGLHLNMLH